MLNCCSGLDAHWAHSTNQAPRLKVQRLFRGSCALSIAYPYIRTLRLTGSL